MTVLQTESTQRLAALAPHDLSLRDYFAATVLLGIAMRGAETWGPSTARQAAHDAYEAADEMLRERGPAV